MQLSRALRLTESPLSQIGRGARGEGLSIAFTGAGGKTTALFLLARELQSSAVLRHPSPVSGPPSILLTATSHLGVWQTSLADHHLIAETPDQLGDLAPGVTLITGPLADDRTTPVNFSVLSWLRATAKNSGLPLLIEADGSRGRPLKAPAEHEPPIPDFVDLVIVTAGLSALGGPLDDDHVHRSHLYSALTGLGPDEPITPASLVCLLAHPQGGLKNIPPHARRVALLNQADTPELKSIGGQIARELLAHYDSILGGSLHQNDFQTFEQTAGIILAAGGSTRFGAPKQLLDWNGQPFVRHVAQTALHAGLWPIVVVIGHGAPEVESALTGLPVAIVHNDAWQTGQASSIRAGLASLLNSESSRSSPLRGEIGSTIFLLADQPQIPVEILRALAEVHAQNLPAILAPLVLEERRANPVLFDRATFPDLLALEGDVGGRAIFDRHRVEYLPWHDDLLLFDVDTPEDYERLKGL
jgi:molybdenum cofactor cytidylyltransferase